MVTLPALRHHWWKLLLLPIFFDVPKWVKLCCGVVLLASVLVDIALEARRRREATSRPRGT
jgi:hypothetical protein